MTQREYLMIAKLRCLTLLSLLVLSGTWARANEFLLEQNIMVPMRDGVRLATDIYRPVADGRVVEEALPVILTRLPYDKQSCTTMGAYYATHGYVFVAQDTRGRYNSEGVWHMLTDDGSDGVDCPAAMVECQDRHDRHLLCRWNATRHGSSQGT